jgi:hypothetical protein
MDNTESWAPAAVPTSHRGLVAIAFDSLAASNQPHRRTGQPRRPYDRAGRG